MSELALGSSPAASLRQANLARRRALRVGRRRLHRERGDGGGRPHPLDDDRRASTSSSSAASCANSPTRARPATTARAGPRGGSSCERTPRPSSASMPAGRTSPSRRRPARRGPRPHARRPRCRARLGTRAARGRRARPSTTRSRAPGSTRADVVAVCVGVPAPVDAAGASPPHPRRLLGADEPGSRGAVLARGRRSSTSRTTRRSPRSPRARGAPRSDAATTCRCSPASVSAPASSSTADCCAARTAVPARWSSSTTSRRSAARGASGSAPRSGRARRSQSGEVAAGLGPARRPARRSSTRRRCSRSRAAGDADARRIVDRVGVALATIVGIFGSLFDSRSSSCRAPSRRASTLVLDAARAATARAPRPAGSRARGVAARCRRRRDRRRRARA